MNCTQCAKATYDEIWGVYKCSVYKRSVSNYEHVGCKEYRKGTPKPIKKDT